MLAYCVLYFNEGFVKKQRKISSKTQPFKMTTNITLLRNDSMQARIAGTIVWQKGQQFMHTRPEFGASLFPSIGDIERVEKFHGCRTPCRDTFRCRLQWSSVVWLWQNSSNVIQKKIISQKCFYLYSQITYYCGYLFPWSSIFKCDKV